MRAVFSYYRHRLSIMDSKSSQRAMGSNYWLHGVSYSIISVSIFRRQGLGRITNCRTVNFYPSPTAAPLTFCVIKAFVSPHAVSGHLRYPIRAGTWQRLGLSPTSLGPRNRVVGQRDPGSGRPPPLGCRGEGEGQVCCGFQWVVVVRALRPRKTQPNLSD